MERRVRRRDGVRATCAAPQSIRPTSLRGVYCDGDGRIHEDRYDDAAALFGKAAQANPGHGMFLLAQTSSLALAGRLDEARPIWAEGLKLEPEFQVRTLLEVGLIPSIFNKLARGHRMLGVRE